MEGLVEKKVGLKHTGGRIESPKRPSTNDVRKNQEQFGIYVLVPPNCVELLRSLIIVGLLKKEIATAHDCRRKLRCVAET